MKAYFTASLRGRENYLDNYTRITETLEDSGFKVMSGDVFSPGAEERVKTQTPEERREAYRRLSVKLKTADLVVAEISTPSISVGHEITSALELGKPVVVLHTVGNGASMLEGMVDERLQVVEYDMENLKKKFLKALDEARKSMDVRFNFFVSPKILNYLDFVAKKRMIPRSVFLRDLIEREMKKDKEFKE